MLRGGLYLDDIQWLAVPLRAGRVRKAYTVIGDAVNLAARLEGVTKHYGVGIVVGEATRASTPRIAYRELDRVRVKGKSEPVAIYEPLGEEVGLSPAVHDELQRWNDALACYRARDWPAAAARVAKLAADYPHRRLYAVYLERIDQLRTDEPSLDWDGIYAFESK